MPTNTKSAEVLRRAMFNQKGDDLERTNHQFQGHDDKQLDAPYGQSGQTCRQVWQGYKDRRADWEAANDLLEDMLKTRGL